MTTAADTGKTQDAMIAELLHTYDGMGLPSQPGSAPSARRGSATKAIQVAVRAYLQDWCETDFPLRRFT